MYKDKAQSLFILYPGVFFYVGRCLVPETVRTIVKNVEAPVHIGGPRWRSGQGAVLQIGRSLVRSQLVPLEFFIDIKSFRSRYGPGVDLPSNRNVYQEYFLGVKAAGA
jgi:hypothetical protein